MASQWKAPVFVQKCLKKNKRNMVNAPFTPFTPPFSWLRVRHPQLLKKKTSKFQSKTSTCNLRSTFYLRSGRIYCILVANRLIGSNYLLFTQTFYHMSTNRLVCHARTQFPISALSIQEFQLLDISPLPRHLSLVNTAIK